MIPITGDDKIKVNLIKPENLNISTSTKMDTKNTTSSSSNSSSNNGVKVLDVKSGLEIGYVVGGEKLGELIWNLNLKPNSGEITIDWAVDVTWPATETVEGL